MVDPRKACGVSPLIRDVEVLPETKCPYLDGRGVVLDEKARRFSEVRMELGTPAESIDLLSPSRSPFAITTQCGKNKKAATLYPSKSCGSSRGERI